MRLWYHARVDHPATQTLSVRFADIINGLRRALSKQGAWCRASGPLGMLIWNRLDRMRRRFTALAERVSAGTLPAAAAPRQRATTPRPAPATPDLPRLPPRRPGWLLGLLPEPWHLAYWRHPLEDLLADPQTAALFQAAPRQVGRILRPLCVMLRVDLPPEFRLPPRPPRPPRPKPAKKPLTPEQLDARDARMGRLAWANFINPETDPVNGNPGRPPNRIGYGRAPPILRSPPKRS